MKKLLFTKIALYALLLLLGIFTTSFFIPQNKTLPDYKNPKLSVEKRIQDLLSKMTLEEKVAQTQCIWRRKKNILDAQGNFSSSKADTALKNGIGQIGRISEGFDRNGPGRSPKETAILVNKIQKHLIEKTRLGIPAMFHEESLHGNQAKDATNFPSPLGLASSWNPDLITEIYTKVAEEVRARGAQQVLAPVVDIIRDPRWGRTEETYGEDPYLVSRLAVATVKAYQGSGATIDKKHVISTLKHFGVHGEPEGGINVGPSFVDERTLREVFFPSFKACVKEAKVLSLMPCYAELSGIPNHTDKKLLTDILRKEWGFTGIVVSDYFAISQLQSLHKVAQNNDESALQAFTAGVDIETPDGVAYTHLGDLVKTNKISAAYLDTVVGRILRMKFILGLFEDPYANPDQAEKIIGNAATRTIALKAAQEAMVLLKNQNNILPLKKEKIKKLAVIGPNADRCILGGYSDVPKQTVSPLQGIKTKAGNQIEILYSEGCRITDKGDWNSDTVVLSKPTENYKRIVEAVEVAKKADVVVLFLGGNEATFREAWETTHLGDNANLDLFGEQNELVKAILAIGKPTVAFIFSGPPMTFNYVNNNVPGIVQCWYLGQETGTAVANVLFGDVNPSGKLPISFPRSVGHIPCYYNHKPSARRGYLFDEAGPMYPFGHGLSYTTFQYDNVKLSKNKMNKNEQTVASVEVTNTGKVKGSEVVQLYIRDKFSSVTRPVKELKGFKKINLKPNEKKTVEFPINFESLAFYDINLNYIVEPGEFEIMIGTSSENFKTTTLEVVE